MQKYNVTNWPQYNVNDAHLKKLNIGRVCQRGLVVDFLGIQASGTLA